MATLFVLGACSTPKNIDYFQDIQNGTLVNAPTINDIKIKPEDKLSILVTTQDVALSALFNLTNTQTVVTGSSPNSQNINEASYYTVSPDGDINFPVLGKLHIEGLTRSQLSKFIEDKLINDNLVKSPIVTVEFINTGISVIGEVKNPGLYHFNKDHMTIIDAIAVAGDLTIDGVRENVLVLRKTSEGTQQGYRVDLTNLRELANSPVYYLQQDDVIYIEPNEKVKRESTSIGNTPFTPAFWISFVSIATTVATLIVTLTR